MDAVLQIFKRSICPGTPFFESLAKKPPITMDDLFRRFWLSGGLLEVTQTAKPPDRPKPVDRRQEGPRLSDFKWPRPIGTDPSMRDHSKKCDFHKDHGHTTETCRSLQYLVEKLIKAGHLKQYLRSDTRGRDASQHHNSGAPRAPEEKAEIVAGRINTRTHQFHPARSNRRGPSPHRRDNHFPTSSSADLVQASVVGHMGHSLAGLENPGRILSGFNGSSTTSLGDIILPVQAGPVTLNVQFSVVQELSPFNVILGRTWLHYMKAIPSTYHQMVSFLTNEGQIDLYGSHNHDIFAWTHSDMKGIHPSIASHKLNVFPAARPVRQKIRRFHPDRQKVIRNEIDKLLEAGFVREVSYPDWLANVVVVPKKEGKWRVCVDYTNLNNACPKDSFPLPRIDQIVDSTSGQGMLSFLDAFSDITDPHVPDDEEKTDS
ncbi:hypothetical protein AAG906_021678 [Vitis piasezkii]